MPVLTGPACLTSVDCPLVPMPPTVAGCTPSRAWGGVNDLYFLPCSQEMTEMNILDTDWWTALLTAGVGSTSVLGNIGRGLGSIAKKSQKTERESSCSGEVIVSTTWALKYIIKAFDKTSADVTTEQLNAILTRYTSFLVIARLCDGDDSIIPIGRFSTSDFDWVLPENSEDLQTATIELSWVEFGKPKIYTVTGLSAVIPKA